MIVLDHFQHCFFGAPVGVSGDFGRKTFGHHDRPGREGQMRRVEIVEKSQSVFDGEEPPDTLCFYTETLLVAESNRNLVLWTDSPHPDARQLPIR